MLVINANNAQEWFILSNSQLGVYPDLKSNLFLSLDNLMDVAANTTPATQTAVETIWGTNINRYSVRFLMPEYLTGLPSWDTQPLWLVCIDSAHSGAYTSVSFRVWLEYWFEGWEIVGEEIIWWGILGILTSSANTNYGYGYVKNVKFTVQLLHSDWTLTQIAEKTLISAETNFWSDVGGEVWKTVPSYKAVHYGSGGFVTPTKTTQTWVTATVWDRLVLDISYDRKISNTATQSCWLFFGYKYTAVDAKRFTPTQVSIR